MAVGEAHRHRDPPSGAKGGGQCVQSGWAERLPGHPHTTDERARAATRARADIQRDHARVTCEAGTQPKSPDEDRAQNQPPLKLRASSRSPLATVSSAAT